MILKYSVFVCPALSQKPGSEVLLREGAGATVRQYQLRDLDATFIWTPLGHQVVFYVGLFFGGEYASLGSSARHWTAQSSLKVYAPRQAADLHAVTCISEFSELLRHTPHVGAAVVQKRDQSTACCLRGLQLRASRLRHLTCQAVP